jgi:peptide/nickel transport system substrate-binding protein
MRKLESMRLPAWAWLALASLNLAPVTAATRPHYGGTLAVNLSTAWTGIEPGEIHTALSLPIVETLVRLDARGSIEPDLAVAWQHDADFKRWRFSLRPKVTFHDGEPLTAANAVAPLLAALKKKYGEVSLQAGGQALVVQSDQAMPDILEQLALPGAAIFRKSDANPLIGTGPFRVTAWEPGRRLTVAAFEDYWGARPYLDSVSIQFGSGHAHADIFDIPVGPTRRILPEGAGTWSSAPHSLVAVTAGNADPMVMQALSLSIDRVPIVNVLAQHRGDAAFGLLPQWLSGYAFLFQSSPDLARAKQLVSQVRLTPLTLSYPANDAFLRSVAERVALNARDAGIPIQPTSNPNGHLRLVEWPLESTDAAAELIRIANTLGAGDRAGQVEPSRPESLYQLERALLDDHRVIPIVYLRETYGIEPRVHFQSSRFDAFALHLEDAWVQP